MFSGRAWAPRLPWPCCGWRAWSTIGRGRRGASTSRNGAIPPTERRPEERREEEKKGGVSHDRKARLAAASRGLCADRRLHDRGTRRPQRLDRLAVLAALRQRRLL